MEKLKIWVKNLLSQKDKIAHMLVNFAIVLIFGVLFNPAVGVAGALVASILKETYDEYKEDGSGWDWKDLAADVIGLVLGIIILL